MPAVGLRPVRAGPDRARPAPLAQWRADAVCLAGAGLGFDSLAVEASGNVCVATLLQGGISVFSPAGEWLEFHAAPEGYCTNLCFGGADRRTAFITLSGYGQLLAARWPRAGLMLAS